MRERRVLAVDVRAPLDAPPWGRSLQFVVRVPGRTAPLEALVVEPAEPGQRPGRSGSADRTRASASPVSEPGGAGPLLLYLLGFNVPLGPWEGAKAQLLANAYEMPVLAVELPGQSRFGDPLPASVTAAMVRGEIDAWSALHVGYVRAALSAARLRPSALHLVGYSTGCSVGMASLRRLAEVAPVRSAALIEPVGALSRPLARLATDNARDVLRQPPSYATNHGHQWVMALRRRQLREPWVRYWPQDLLAITRVLCRDHMGSGLGEVDGAPLTIVRGERSDLCRAAGVAALEAGGASGTTITVPGFGHPLWHSFPVVVPLVGLLAGSCALVAGGR